MSLAGTGQSSEMRLPIFPEALGPRLAQVRSTRGRVLIADRRTVRLVLLADRTEARPVLTDSTETRLVLADNTEAKLVLADRTETRPVLADSTEARLVLADSTEARLVLADSTETRSALFGRMLKSPKVDGTWIMRRTTFRKPRKEHMDRT